MVPVAPRDLSERVFDALSPQLTGATDAYSDTVHDFLAECVAFPAIRVPSAWMEHSPLVIGLVRMLRPRRFVELGTHHGHSFYSIVEAMGLMEGNGLGEAIAIDSWEGDPQAGYYGQDVFVEFEKLLEHCKDTVGFMRTDFDQASSHFASSSIDLLHIDGFHAYRSVRHDFSEWLPKLSPGAVVLFHDVNEYGPGFGAWKLWAGLTDEFPRQTMVLGNAHGLGLFVNNPSDYDWVGKLLEWWHGDSANRVFLQDLSMRLGHLLRQEWTSRDNTERQSVEKEADLLRQLSELTAERDALRRRLRRRFPFTV